MENKGLSTKERLLHTQEVRCSTHRAPTIFISKLASARPPVNSPDILQNELNSFDFASHVPASFDSASFGQQSARGVA